MKCRCGHGRQWHKRKSGYTNRQPCWAVVNPNTLYHAGRTKRSGAVCRCRNFVLPTD